MPEIMIDESKRFVRVTYLADQMMTMDDVRRCNAEVATQLEIAVKRFGKILMMVDSRKMSVLPPEVARCFDPAEKMLRNPEDRYALVVGSYLGKIQSQCVIGNDNRARVFLSVHAAEAWLLDNQISAYEAEAAMKNSAQR